MYYRRPLKLLSNLEIALNCAPAFNKTSLFLTITKMFSQEWADPFLKSLLKKKHWCDSVVSQQIMGLLPR